MSEDRVVNEQRKSTVIRDIVVSVVSGIILAGLFFFTNDVCFGIPSLDGKWNVRCEYSEGKYRGMQADFIALVQLSGPSVQGSFEKKSETSVDGKVTKYNIEKRNQASITGYVTKKYFSHDTMAIHVDEQGRLMSIKDIQLLKIMNERLIKGTFSTTRGEHAGTVTWTR